MSKATASGDEAILAALDGIVRMQRTIRGGLDLCVDTGLVFVRTYYSKLPENVARRLTEINPVALAAIPGATSYQGSEKARKNIASNVASDAAFAQAIRAANVYREKLGHELLGPDGAGAERGGGRVSEGKTVAKKMLAAEIVRALRYLEGADISAEEKRQIVEKQSYQLAREAQLLREAVMLRQQREAAEYVRETIQAEKAAKRPRTGLLPS